MPTTFAIIIFDAYDIIAIIISDACDIIAIIIFDACDINIRDSSIIITIIIECDAIIHDVVYAHVTPVA